MTAPVPSITSQARTRAQALRQAAEAGRQRARDVPGTDGAARRAAALLAPALMALETRSDEGAKPAA